MLGANMSVRSSVVRELGGIRDFYPGTCLREETDIALRMRRHGMRVVYTPFAVVDHVGGRYARGRRFDSRYRYFGARNHVVLLATTLGWRDSARADYGRTVLRRSRHEVLGGLRAFRHRQGARSKLTGLAGGVRRSSVDLPGSVAGAFAAFRATSALRRRGSVDVGSTPMCWPAIRRGSPRASAPYYHLVDRIVVSYDRSGRSWAGHPLSVRGVPGSTDRGGSGRQDPCCPGAIRIPSVSSSSRDRASPIGARRRIGGRGLGYPTGYR